MLYMAPGSTESVRQPTKIHLRLTKIHLPSIYPTKILDTLKVCLQATKTNQLKPSRLFFSLRGARASFGWKPREW